MYEIETAYVWEIIAPWVFIAKHYVGLITFVLTWVWKGGGSYVLGVKRKRRGFWSIRLFKMAAEDKNSGRLVLCVPKVDHKR